jgi:hypothetical protein
VCISLSDSECQAQSVHGNEKYFNIDWTTAGNDYESSGGGYMVLEFTGSNTGTTIFSVSVVDNGNTTTSTISLAPMGTSSQTYSVSKHGATITVNILTTTIGIFSIGEPSTDDQYCVGASDANGVDAYFSTQRIAQIPDDLNHNIHHHCFTAPFDSTVKMIPKADGHMYYSNVYITANTTSGNYLLIDEQFTLPNWDTVSDYWVDAP